MYCDGTLSSTQKVMVDIGTGYFVEKTVEAAREFYKSKGEYLKGQLENLQNTIQEKQNSLQLVVETIQYKVRTEKKEK